MYERMGDITAFPIGRKPENKRRCSQNCPGSASVGAGNRNQEVGEVRLNLMR